jgi:hypothetical protein
VLAILALVQVLACGGEEQRASGAAGDAVMEETSTILVAESVEARGPQSEPGSPVDLFNPGDVLVVGDRVVVSDNGNDRVVLMDKDLKVQSVVGRSGGGPGEFEGPSGLRQYGDGFAVFDFGNTRFTVLGPDGAYRSVVRSPMAALNFAVTSGGRFYTPHRHRLWYLLRLDGESVKEFAARPDTGAVADSLEYFLGGQDPFVAVTAGDTVHVLDGSAAVLHKYDPEGNLVQSRSLPVTLADTLLRRSSEVREQFEQGDKLISVPFVKGFTVTGSGSLLLLVAGSEKTVALVIDPHTYRAQRVVVPDGSPEWRPLLTTPAAYLYEPVLYVLQDVEVLAFRLAERQ